jgi:hypothetical protein
MKIHYGMKEKQKPRRNSGTSINHYGMKEKKNLGGNMALVKTTME